MPTRAEWAQAIQKALGFDPTHDGDVALVNVFVAEGSRAENNPADTIQPEPGATPYNTFDKSLHVWNYPTMDEGITAIVATFHNGLNAAVLTALQEKRDAQHITAAIATASSWDSAGSLYIDTLPHTAADYPTVAAVEVAPATGTGPVKEPPVTDPVATETQTVEADAVGDAGAVNNDANEAVTDAKAGKVQAMREELSQAKTHIANLETHLAELEALVK